MPDSVPADFWKGVAAELTSRLRGGLGRGESESALSKLLIGPVREAFARIERSEFVTRPLCPGIEGPTAVEGGADSGMDARGGEASGSGAVARACEERTRLAELVLSAALDCSLARQIARYGVPRTPDGEPGRVSIIGLGAFGGRELDAESPLEVMFLCDLCGVTDGGENIPAEEFFRLVASGTSALVSGLYADADGKLRRLFNIVLDYRPGGPTGPLACTVTEAIRHYQSQGRSWERLLHTQSRRVAGSIDLGDRFIEQLEPWVYPKYRESVDRDGMQTLLRKQLRRVTAAVLRSRDDAARGPLPAGLPDLHQAVGGIDDIVAIVNLLKVIHGGDDPRVRRLGTSDAIAALRDASRIGDDDAKTLFAALRTLSACQDALSACQDTLSSSQAEGSIAATARRLGVISSDGSGDQQTLHTAIDGALRAGREVISKLLEESDVGNLEVAIETDLLLDPEPDPELFAQALGSHGMTAPDSAVVDLQRLADEPVPYLSSRRCRHRLAAIAPRLLAEIALTPFPDATLRTLAEVSDSLGGKATLWELMETSSAAMSLFVRLCAGSPYLATILTRHPGMIDELIDSLSLHRLPSAAWLENASSELCRGAMDIQGVMQGFKNAAHLRIGVRDLLGKESLESTHAALASTAESILRRTAEWTQRELADQYGDPVNDRGEPIDYVIVALGKLGGREPNYHSVLEAVFLVTGEGQTRRRVGGNRKTITTQDFFDELTLRLYRTVRDASTRSRMYDFATPLAISQSTADGRRVMSLDTLREHFLNRRADLRDRLAICKARAISGQPESRTRIDAAIREMLIAGGWGTGDAYELLALRQGMEQTAAQDNLKRAVGGSVDVELATQGLQLKHASDHPEIVVPGTIEALGQIAEAGLIDPALATKLQGNYRFLREVESKLRLLDTPGRHEIPEDSGSLRRLAFLLNRGGSLKDAEQIVAQCRDVRADNRRLFNSVIGLLSE